MGPRGSEEQEPVLFICFSGIFEAGIMLEINYRYAKMDRYTIGGTWLVAEAVWSTQSRNIQRVTSSGT